jgi:hypothetical protein
MVSEFFRGLSMRGHGGRLCIFRFLARLFWERAFLVWWGAVRQGMLRPSLGTVVLGVAGLGSVWLGVSKV